MSYTGIDRVWGEWIAWQLEEAGYRVVIQAWDFRPGSDFVVNMRDAAAGAERTIAVLSPAYVASAFGVAEWAAAFAADPTGKAQKLVPVRVAEFEAEGFDRTRVFIDLVGVDEEAARGRLLVGVDRARAKPGVAPRFPSSHAVAIAPRFPGALPAVWNVPHHRNPNFTGRQEILDALAAAVSPGGGLVPRAIVGLGGMGKTQLAVEYAYRHLGDFDVVWWVRAEEPANALRDFAGLGSGLGLPAEADVALAASAVRCWLEGHNRWLVVADNAVSPNGLADLIPRGGGGQVLITSRGGDWASTAQVLALGELNEDEAVDMLGRRSGDIDRAAARVLAGELGYLPLALEQAAAFVAETPALSVAAYLGILRDRATDLLARGRPHGYPATLATTWSLAFESVEKHSPPGAALLQACSFLNPDAIPLSLLAAAELPEPLAAVSADPLALADALGVLGRYSLVRGTSSETVGVHRLVQLVVRDRLGNEGRGRWAAIVVMVMANAFPADSDDVRSWDRCSLLLPHALAAAGHAEQANVQPAATGWLLDRAATYLQGRAQFKEAKVLLEHALAITEAALGPDHPAVGARLSNLATVLKDLGDYTGALLPLERALVIDEAAYGPDHPSVAIDLSILAMVLQSLGDYNGARERLERALAIDEAAYGPNHRAVGTRLNNLATVLKNLGDYNGARQRLERALAIDEVAYGPNHPVVGICLNNLATVLQGLDDHNGARKRLERALAIAEAAYGPDHPTVGTRLINLATVLYNLGDYDGARQRLERALAIDEATYSPDHPRTATTRRLLDELLRAPLSGDRSATSGNPQ